MDIKDVKELGHWQIAIAAAGVAITLAAIAAGAKPMVLAGLGVGAFGIGQMRSHPLQTKVLFDDFGRVAGKITGHPRTFSVLGLALEALGAVMFGGGLTWYLLV